MVIGQVYMRMKEYTKAMASMQEAMTIVEAAHGENSEQVGNCYLEMA